MKLSEAQLILQKLKPLENIIKAKNGFPIHKFFIVPTRLIKNKEIDFYNIWNNENIFQTKLNENLDFKIVGVHRSGSNTFWISKDTEYFKNIVLK